ncbi:MAG: aldo/keto reductase [Ignavibacteriales bacterium]|nr:aldo/keto reductase [Ignavibacteriales bacterium]
MKTRQLGKNGPHLSEIGFGAWAIGGPWIYGWGAVDDLESMKALHRALDLGINWIDTAAAYGFGHSEEVVGKALKGKKNVFVATKCGLVPDGKGDAYRNSKPESIRQEIHQSLRRLKVDCIDLYQIHWPDASVPYEESWETLVRLQEEGKARYIGVSNYDVSMLEKCMKIHHVQSLQPPYSMLVRDVEREALEYCKRNGIGIFAYSPMQSGLLTGRFDINRLAPDDWRHGSSMFHEPTLSHALALVEKLRPMSARYGKTVGQLAVQWVLSHDEITCAIVGARTAKQVEDIIGSAGFQISPDDMMLIDSLTDEFRRTLQN